MECLNRTARWADPLSPPPSAPVSVNCISVSWMEMGWSSSRKKNCFRKIQVHLGVIFSLLHWTNFGPHDLFVVHVELFLWLTCLIFSCAGLSEAASYNCGYWFTFFCGRLIYSQQLQLLPNVWYSLCFLIPPSQRVHFYFCPKTKYLKFDLGL